MVDEVLVERVVGGDQHAGGGTAGPAGATEPLPERRGRAGVAGEEDRVEAAHVDAELERLGGRHPDEAPVAELLLERAPFVGEVAAAVRADGVGQRRVTEALAGEQRHELGGLA